MTRPLTIIAGPCVVEKGDGWLANIAGALHNLVLEYGPPNTQLIFKASVDKANRSKLDGFRGIGRIEGLVELQKVRERVPVNITTDVHELYQPSIAAHYVDVLQIPAFLARQTDLLVNAALTGKQVSIKIPPWADENEAAAIRRKFLDAGGVSEPWMIYRGSFIPGDGIRFRGGIWQALLDYGEFRPWLDITHSNGGDKYGSISLALKAASAYNCGGLFMEVHPDPANALCDSRHQLDYEQFKMILMLLKHQAEAENARPV